MISNTNSSIQLSPENTAGVQQTVAADPTTDICLHPLSSHILQMTMLQVGKQRTLTVISGTSHTTHRTSGTDTVWDVNLGLSVLLQTKPSGRFSQLVLSGQGEGRLLTWLFHSPSML